MQMSSYLRILFIILVSAFASACTHLHNDLIPAQYHQQKIVNFQDKEPKIQILVTRGPFYFTHSAIRIQNNERILFWDPSGSYGGEEHALYFKEHPLPLNFEKKNSLIIHGIPDLELYWLFAQFTDDTGMEVFEWSLTNKVATHFQSVLLAGAEEGENQYDFKSQDIVLLCSSALSRFVIRFVSDVVPLDETFFFPDSLAHKLYTLNPDRIILFEKGGETRVFRP